MLFREIIGQQEIKRKLTGMVDSGRMPHALLLHGPPGTGKKSLAVAMARYLSCADRREGDACGVCSSCVKFNKLVHPDLHFVVPVVNTTQGSAGPVTDHFLEEWREAFLANPYLSENQWYETIGAGNKQGVINKDESLLAIRKLNFKPYESEYRMMIIWLPEKMNLAAANKLLKQLEEPPGLTLIIMVSENTDRIIPTILSRAQLVQVPPLDPGILREGLLKTRSGDPELLEDAVRKANGNFNVALATLGKDEQELKHFESFTSLMRLCYTRNIIGVSDWVDEMAGQGREQQKQLLEYSLRLLRENFILHMDQADLNFMSSREAEFSENFSPFIHEGNIHDLVASFTSAANHIEANGNPRIVLMDLSIRAIRLLRQKAPVEA